MYKAERKTEKKPKHLTAQDLINAKLMKDNANMQLQLQAQQKLNADLMLKVAKLGGN